MPQARTRTSTSSGPIAGTGMPTISSSIYCFNKSAFIASSNIISRTEPGTSPERCGVHSRGGACAHAGRAARAGLIAAPGHLPAGGRTAVHGLRDVAFGGGTAMGARADSMADSARHGVCRQRVPGRRLHHRGAVYRRLPMGARGRDTRHFSRLVRGGVVRPLRNSAHAAIAGRRAARGHPGGERHPPALHAVAHTAAAAERPFTTPRCSPRASFPSAAFCAISGPGSPSPRPCRRESAPSC